MIILDKLANFTKDLLQYDEKKIIISRTNFDRMDTTDDLIVIDNILSTPIANSISYDGENQIISTVFVGDFQILFYGVDALQNAIAWQNMLLSQLAVDLKSELGIHIFNTTTHNNLRIEDGTNYDELYQCDFKVRYCESTTISVDPIDNAELTFLNDK